MTRISKIINKDNLKKYIAGLPHIELKLFPGFYNLKYYLIRFKNTKNLKLCNVYKFNLYKLKQHILIYSINSSILEKKGMQTQKFLEKPLENSSFC